ncbi:HAD-IIIA family hydrolase [Lutimonas saemankumensis]|uniref:KdsC family phosphatase n=1 Tax=Lutimonas saemankumensis TaxID=483016 RepID=UPI001CD71341|nr:HAD-IIIA family hydrolase [Lutimonas saemankumensis]MCA0931516.1 HAD-IIIA family hydrolase [Lutimonas saemankumensis]
MGKNYKELMPSITTFIFDVDGVLTDGTVTVFPNGELIRSMNIKDGYALKTAVQEGFNVCIISGGTNEAVKSRLRGLGITDIYLGAHNKTEQLDEYLDIYDINPENVLYMGDDIPDIPVMKLCGLPACPKDAVPEVQRISGYISQKRGGKGCVRDVIEQVLKVQDKWHNHFDAKLD